jgi:hypothetical protein
MNTVLTFDGTLFKFEKQDDVIFLNSISAHECNGCDIYKVTEEYINYFGKKVPIPERFRSCFCDIVTGEK